MKRFLRFLDGILILLMVCGIPIGGFITTFIMEKVKGCHVNFLIGELVFLPIIALLISVVVAIYLICCCIKTAWEESKH